MDFKKPSTLIYTVYTKSGCPFCVKAKDLLSEKKYMFEIVDCDEYLSNNKAAFLEFIKEHAEKEYKTFPMVFRAGCFIGGYTETKNLIDLEDLFSNI